MNFLLWYNTVFPEAVNLYALMEDVEIMQIYFCIQRAHELFVNWK